MDFTVRYHVAFFVIGLIFTSYAFPIEGEPNPLYESQGYYGTQTGSEVIDIIFVIDGSTSISSTTFNLQKQGILNCLQGPQAFIPTDGSTAIGIIQFANTGFVEINLSVVNESTFDELVSTVEAITKVGGGTDIARGVTKSIELFEQYAYGYQYFLVISTDQSLFTSYSDPLNDSKVALAHDIRTTSGQADGMAHPAKICTVFVGHSCVDPPIEQQNDLLHILANTADSGSLLIPPNPGQPAFPNELVGHYSCATNDLNYPPLAGSWVEDYLLLCKECTCSFGYDDEPDNDGNGIPDICEVDCNNNSMPDPTDIVTNTSLDCNENSIPDECEPPTVPIDDNLANLAKEHDLCFYKSCNKQQQVMSLYK